MSAEQTVTEKLPNGSQAYLGFWRKAMADEKNPFRDVVLVVGPEQQQIPCNRFVLASNCTFFSRYFEDEKHLQTDGSPSSTVPLPDLSGPAVEAIIAGLVTHDFTCSLDQLEACCKAADFLGVEVIQASFTKAVQEWEKVEAAKGAAAHAAYLVKLAQLGDRYHFPALVEHACRTGMTAPAELMKPHISEWPPAALLPYLWEGHLGTVADLATTKADLAAEKEATAMKAMQIQNYEWLHAESKYSRTLMMGKAKVACCPSLWCLKQRSVEGGDREVDIWYRWSAAGTLPEARWNLSL